MMPPVNMFDTSSARQRDQGLDAAIGALKRGELVVMPTDTVYGVAADAFNAQAVAALQQSKGRGRDKPPPVLIADSAVMAALAIETPQAANDLAAKFWPGPLTLVCRAQPSLAWDLGNTGGTVALRVPDDHLALELLRRAGPTAVSSANRSGNEPALTARDANAHLGESVSVYLEAGPARGEVPSTIVDVTGETATVLRHGAIDIAALRQVCEIIDPNDDGDELDDAGDAPAVKSAPAQENEDR